MNGFIFLGDLDDFRLTHKVYFSLEDLRKIIATMNVSQGGGGREGGRKGGGYNVVSTLK